MTALPDTIMPERGRSPMMEITLPDGMDSTHLIKVVVWRFLSVVSLLAAIGVWIVPSAPQDTLMPLIKLVFFRRVRRRHLIFYHGDAPRDDARDHHRPPEPPDKYV